jgi:hypothetical protein
LLLTLLAIGEADLPQGMRLDTPAGFTFDRLSAGEQIFYRYGILVFENTPLEVDLRQARRWRCYLPSLGADLSDPAVAEAWMCAWQALNTRQRRLGAEIVARDVHHANALQESGVSRRVGEAVRTLVGSTRGYQLEDPALLRLIGLGSGLTPCGDDFLVGYLAGLWCAVRDSAARERYVVGLGEAAILYAGQTNDISRTFLYHAAHGQVSSRLEALARAICTPQNPGQLMAAAEAAMRSGHTSGMDAVTGLLFGLAAWDGKPDLGAG